MDRVLKPKCCKACRNDFQPRTSMQVVCFSPVCAQAYAQAKRHAAERKEVRKKLAAIKPRSQWNDEAQKEFNAYIRLRDAGKGCICCPQSAGATSGNGVGGEFDAGHYRSRGAASHLRFDERNCHLQSKRCNRYAFDVAAYRRGLVARIGLAEVEALEADNAPRKFDIPTLKLIRDTYRAKTKALKAQRESMLEAA